MIIFAISWKLMLHVLVGFLSILGATSFNHEERAVNDSFTIAPKLTLEPQEYKGLKKRVKPKNYKQGLLETYEQRLQTLHAACDNHKDLMSRKLWDRSLIINDQYKLTYCPLEKVATQTWTRRLMALKPESRRFHFGKRLPAKRIVHEIEVIFYFAVLCTHVFMCTCFACDQRCWCTTRVLQVCVCMTKLK